VNTDIGLLCDLALKCVAQQFGIPVGVVVALAQCGEYRIEGRICPQLMRLPDLTCRPFQCPNLLYLWSAQAGIHCLWDQRQQGLDGISHARDQTPAERIPTLLQSRLESSQGERLSIALGFQ